MVCMSFSGFLVFGFSLILLGLVMSSYRLLNVLVVLENMNVLLLLCCLFGQISEVRVMFVSLMVIFTIEVTLALVVITRLWSSSVLVDIVGL